VVSLPVWVARAFSAKQNRVPHVAPTPTEIG
jgi:hypothetical protein